MVGTSGNNVDVAVEDERLSSGRFGRSSSDNVDLTGVLRWVFVVVTPIDDRTIANLLLNLSICRTNFAGQTNRIEALLAFGGG